MAVDTMPFGVGWPYVVSRMHQKHLGVGEMLGGLLVCSSCFPATSHFGKQFFTPICHSKMPILEAELASYCGRGMLGKGQLRAYWFGSILELQDLLLSCGVF